MKKSTIILSMLVAASSVFAVDDIWNGNGGDTDYNNAANWNKGWVPQAADKAITKGETNIDIIMDSTPAASPSEIWLGSNVGANLHTLTINGATLSGFKMKIGYDRGAYDDVVGNGLLTLNNAAITLSSNLEVGTRDNTGTTGASGDVVVNGGTLNANQIILGKSSGFDGTITLNNGAAVTVNNFKLALSGSAVGTLNLNSGSLTVNNGWSGTGTGYIDIAEGTVLIANKTDIAFKFVDMAALGNLTVSGGLTDASAFAGYTQDAGSFTGTGGTAYWGHDGTGTALWSVAAIPEPATLSMVAALGGGILFIRRRFMA